ncbi:MAG TPA: acetylornithine deacetylase [Myxococcales bacterium]|jgi:acetylornithine deacetylase|nr:acetylornithine deacetylase [Myxococcales bacterium]
MTGREGELDREESLRRRLADLVAIDSTSTRSNRPMVDVLEPELSRLGFECQRQVYRDPAGVEKVNLVSVRPGRHYAGRPPVPPLALVGHTDCVPFDPAWSGALRLEARDGKLYGRGACDTKAFIACALEACARVRKHDAPLMTVFTADEELGCFGAKQLVDARLGRARYAIVGEPTQLRPVHANKGYCLLEVVVRGKEGHSAYPDLGRSAIFHAARLLERLEKLARNELRVELDPKFDPPFTTLNVGMISGGKAKNVIPGECRFTVEWRPIPSQRTEMVPEWLDEMVHELRQEEPAFEAEVQVQRMDRGVETPVGSEVVQLLVRATGKEPVTVAFGTEAPQLTALGAEAVVFGPGNIQVAHQTGEFVPVDELVRAEEILEHAIQQLCGGGAR